MATHALEQSENGWQFFHSPPNFLEISHRPLPSAAKGAFAPLTTGELPITIVEVPTIVELQGGVGVTRSLSPSGGIIDSARAAAADSLISRTISWIRPRYSSSARCAQQGNGLSRTTSVVAASKKGDTTAV